MGPTGVPAFASGFGGAVSWIKAPPPAAAAIASSSSTSSSSPAPPPTPQQLLRQAVEAELAATLADAAMPSAQQLTAAGFRPWGTAAVNLPVVQVGPATSVSFDPSTGAIVGLQTNASGSSASPTREWSSPQMPLGLLRHAGHDEAQCNLYRNE